MLLTSGMDPLWAFLKEPSGTNKTQISVRNRSVDKKGNCMWRVKLHSIFNQYANRSHYISGTCSWSAGDEHLIEFVLLHFSVKLIGKSFSLFFKHMHLLFSKKETLHALNTHQIMCNIKVQTFYSSTFMQEAKKYINKKNRKCILTLGRVRKSEMLTHPDSRERCRWTLSVWSMMLSPLSALERRQQRRATLHWRCSSSDRLALVFASRRLTDTMGRG